MIINDKNGKRNREIDSTKMFSKININWYPGHMAKTKKQIIEDLKLIDIVVQIVDARIPISSINPDLNQYIKDKKQVIVLNKSDLSDEYENKKWIEYYKKKNISAVLSDLNTGKGIHDVVREIEKAVSDDKKILVNKGRIGKSIRVMVIGIPNVGKSSFINRMTNKVSAQVGNKPGVTRQKQWIRVNDNIQLLDTPGVLWPKFENEKIALNLAFTGTIKDEVLEKIEIAYELLKYLLENYESNVLERYKLNVDEVKFILSNNDNMENENILQIMHLIGKKRGAIVSGGRIDEQKVADIILDDFRSGKLGKITLEKI